MDFAGQAATLENRRGRSRSLLSKTRLKNAKLALKMGGKKR
jgi:hypothetical protein